MQHITSATRHGAIATPHHLATEAGAEIFRRGGNALDAAIAASAVLTVVYPHNTSIGGDSVSLVRRPDGSTVCVNATGPAPLDTSLDALRARYGARLPIRGVDAITVPGAVRGWETIRALGARMPWHELLAPAVPFAEVGVPVAPSLAAAIDLDLEQLRGDQGIAEIFLPGGKPLTEGEPLIQKKLAATLRLLIEQGPDGFYAGEIGRTLVSGLRRLGSRLTEQDFSRYLPVTCEPLVGEYRGSTVLTSPPNTQGFLLLRYLLAIADLEDNRDVLGADANMLAELFEAGSRVRETLLADPVFDEPDMERLLRGTAPPAAASQLDGVPRGDTVGISAVDSDGYAISYAQSLFFHFGSAVLEPETGILMHNRGTSFSLDPSSGNRIAPGKRPSHTLMSVMVERDDSLAWVNACMGGKGQAQVHAQLLLRQLAGKSSHDTVSEPRFVIGSYGPSEPEDLLHIEDGETDIAVASLETVDLPKVVEPRFDEKFGQANVIAVLSDGSFDAAADPRSDGSAAVVELP